MKKKSLKIIFYLKLYIIKETKWDKNHTQSQTRFEFVRTFQTHFQLIYLYFKLYSLHRDE